MTNLDLVSSEDVKTGRRRGKKIKDISQDNRKGRFRSGEVEIRVLTKKSKKQKEDLIEKSGLKGKKHIEVKKTIRIPVHYDITKTKIDILNRLTARITYGIRLIGESVSDVYGDTLLNGEQQLKLSNNDDINNILKPKVIEELVKASDIDEKTGLSSEYIQQCINKVMWMFKSHRKLHKKWEGKIERAEERLCSPRDDKERERSEKCKITAKAVLEKLRKREPSKPFEGKGYNYNRKIPCRIDYRTGTVEEGKGKLSKLCNKQQNAVIKISTLEKYNRIDIPLNPSQYHINQLKDAIVDDFEIIKGGNSRKCKDKYYIHVTITKIIEEKSINSIGGIDQGLNKSIAAVLLPLDYNLDNNGSFPREEQLLDSAKRSLLEKYDTIVSELQEAEKLDKLRELRTKRENVSVYHDWVLANKTAEFTEGSYVAIGNSKFRQTQFRGNRMVKLRKRIGKWSYSRQRKFISLKRSEMGYRTELKDEYGTSRECCECVSNRQASSQLRWSLALASSPIAVVRQLSVSTCSADADKCSRKCNDSRRQPTGGADEVGYSRGSASVLAQQGDYASCARSFAQFSH